MISKYFQTIVSVLYKIIKIRVHTKCVINVNYLLIFCIYAYNYIILFQNSNNSS